MERLQEYNELAAQYDANYKDTVEEAERTGGVIEVRPIDTCPECFSYVCMYVCMYVNVGRDLGAQETSEGDAHNG
jgi:hypothetical protein